MNIDLACEDDRWTALDLDALATRAAGQTLSCLGIDPEDCEISLLACDDSRIAALNREFRGKPLPTNVLSWPAQDLAAEAPGAQPDPPEADFTGELALGDIALAWETCTSEAAAAGKPLADHVAHLLVHGLLHLLGYDHVRDPDATLMEALETRILGKMGIDDPYSGDIGP
jgi:probable rRNA maturation factor